MFANKSSFFGKIYAAAAAVSLINNTRYERFPRMSHHVAQFTRQFIASPSHVREPINLNELKEQTKAFFTHQCIVSIKLQVNESMNHDDVKENSVRAYFKATTAINKKGMSSKVITMHRLIISLHAEELKNIRKLMTKNLSGILVLILCKLVSFDSRKLLTCF